MRAVDLIRRKRDSGELTSEEIHQLIALYTRGDIPDYQMSAWLMAVVLRGMSRPEIAALTEAMLNSGRVLDFSDLAGRKVDKHSTGGVGDKTSLIIAPIVAAGGLKVPMISGRGLGHSGGTLDKLESIPGFNVNLSLAEFRHVLETCGCALIGQTAEIAPADKKIYALRDVTGTVESPALICASIMSKKLAEGIDALVLDVKTGSGAFMKNIEDAENLAELLVETGKRMGKKVVALLTDMNQPLGLKAGNAMEVAESIEVLAGGGPGGPARALPGACGMDVLSRRAREDAGRREKTLIGSDCIGAGARKIPGDCGAARRRCGNCGRPAPFGARGADSRCNEPSRRIHRLHPVRTAWRRWRRAGGRAGKEGRPGRPCRWPRVSQANRGCRPARRAAVHAALQLPRAPCRSAAPRRDCIPDRAREAEIPSFPYLPSDWRIMQFVT